MKYFRSIKSLINFKFNFIRRSYGNHPFKLLDVGSGNHSASRIRAIFPNCEYYGLDINKEYNNNEADFRAMEDFFELDLTRLDYGIIPDQFFDGIWMAHVIEHLPNGDEVVRKLISKLKPGGFFYLEYPGQHSTKLPSMPGSLNFYDDPTHVRIYSVTELSLVFEREHCTVLKSGIRRNWFYIFALPARALITIMKKGRLEGNLFWDLLGFAEFLYVRKIY